MKLEDMESEANPNSHFTPVYYTVNTGVATWQLCPKCSGVGTLQVYQSTDITSVNNTCDVCNGKKIISVITGQPPMF